MNVCIECKNGLSLMISRQNKGSAYSNATSYLQHAFFTRGRILSSNHASMTMENCDFWTSSFFIPLRLTEPNIVQEDAICNRLLQLPLSKYIYIDNFKLMTEKGVNLVV